MRHLVTAVLAALALTIGAATPVSGQVPDDPAELGFEINPDAGSPGDPVAGQVDVADLRQHCWSAISVGEEQWQAGEATAHEVVTSMEMALFSYFFPADVLNFIIPFFFGDPEGELEAAWVEVYGPVPDTNVGNDITEAARTSTPPEGIPDDTDGQNFVNRIGGAFVFLGGLAAGEFAEVVFPAFHVLTFADPATQALLGETANFDPFTGSGIVAVPDLDPGLYGVAAACVFLPSWDDFPQAYDAGLVSAWNWSVENDFFPTSTAPSGWQDWGEAGGFEALLAPMLEPKALGVETFCVDCEPPPSQDLLDQFCGVLPEIQAVPDQLAALFGGVDIDDPNTYPSVEAVEAFVTNVATLLELGDTSVPPEVQVAWTTATAELRELVLGLTAIGFDFALLVDLSPDDAARLVEVGSGEGEPNPEFDAAVEVLTAFFVDNCVPAAPPAEPTPAEVRFTG